MTPGCSFASTTPYTVAGGPIPLHRYRRFKTTPTQKRANRVETLAKQLKLPVSAIGTVRLPTETSENEALPVQDFVDPDPFQELAFSNTIAAKLAIADFLGKPLAKLAPEQLAQIDAILESTLSKEAVFSQVRDYFAISSGRPHA